MYTHVIYINCSNDSQCDNHAGCVRFPIVRATMYCHDRRSNIFASSVNVSSAIDRAVKFERGPGRGLLSPDE